MSIKLGTVVTDTITGFTGVATARTEFLFGCVRVCVEPKSVIEGKPAECHWFDEQRLDAASPATSGGPGPVPPSRDCPRR